MGRTYTEKLADPLWKKRRLERLKLAGNECESCGETGKTLHVHHRVYHRGHEPWEYTDEELEVLCKDCHDSEHEASDELKLLLGVASMGSRDMVLGILAAHNSMDRENPLPVTSYEQAEGVVLALLHQSLVNDRKMGKLVRLLMDSLTKDASIDSSELKKIGTSLLQSL